MLKNCVPDLKISDVYALDLQKLKEKGIKGIIFDVDNTLESHTIKEPGQKVIDFIKRVKQSGFAVCIVSNGKTERVELFNKKIKVATVAMAYKPLKRGYKKALSLLGTSPERTAIVGDQIFTDVYGGNRMGLYTILVEPIEEIENSFFYIKRFFEHLILKKAKE